MSKRAPKSRTEYFIKLVMVSVLLATVVTFLGGMYATSAPVPPSCDVPLDECIPSCSNDGICQLPNYTEKEGGIPVKYKYNILSDLKNISQSVSYRNFVFDIMIWTVPVVLIGYIISNKKQNNAKK